MRETVRQVVDWIRQGHFQLLAGCLFFLLIALAFVEDSQLGDIARHAGLTLVLVVGLLATRNRRRLFVPGLLIACLAAPIVWATSFSDSVILFITGCLLASLYFVLVGAVVLNDVLRHHQARVNSIFGAISVYLLMGLSAALLYWSIDRVQPEAFDIPNRQTIQSAGDKPDRTSLSQFVYFSFVTLTTLGYGDVTPMTPMTRTLTWVLAVVGQFFIAVLVAHLVSALPRAADRVA